MLLMLTVDRLVMIRGVGSEVRLRACISNPPLVLRCSSGRAEDRPLCFSHHRIVATGLRGEASLRRALANFIDHFHAERNHQGKGGILQFPSGNVGHHRPRTRERCHERLGGLLKYYSYAA
jgi:hypothetical protein